MDYRALVVAIGVPLLIVLFATAVVVYTLATVLVLEATILVGMGIALYRTLRRKN